MKSVYNETGFDAGSRLTLERLLGECREQVCVCLGAVVPSGADTETAAHRMYCC